MGDKEERMIIQQSRLLMLRQNDSIDSICKSLYISETGLRNIYLKHFGVPPKRYMHCLHMEQAKSLLELTDLSIAEIANHANYVSASKFSISFKKQFHITPCEYRKKFEE